MYILQFQGYKERDHLLFMVSIILSTTGFDPPIARECLLEFDTRSNNPSHHGKNFLKFKGW